MGDSWGGDGSHLFARLGQQDDSMITVEDYGDGSHFFSIILMHL